MTSVWVQNYVDNTHNFVGIAEISQRDWNPRLLFDFYAFCYAKFRAPNVEDRAVEVASWPGGGRRFDLDSGLGSSLFFTRADRIAVATFKGTGNFPHPLLVNTVNGNSASIFKQTRRLSF